MSWRFRRSFKVIPGVRLNLSKSGLSCSIGVAPFTVNVSPRGVYSTASFPGTGLSYRHRGIPDSGQQPSTAPPLPLPDPKSIKITPEDLRRVVSVPPKPPSVEEIRSQNTELLTSESLKQLKSVILTAYIERADLEAGLVTTRAEQRKASIRFSSWNRGFLFKRLFTAAFAQRKAALETLDAQVSELEAQLRLTTVAASMELSKEQAEPYFRMRDAFASLSECSAIWDIKIYRATDRVKERTIADKSVTRERVSFSLGSCDLLEWDQKVPHLANANGGDLFLYPGFILYRAAKEAFSVIDFKEVQLTNGGVRFNEEEGTPIDSTVIGYTWHRANKDGSRDMRFVNNYQIPIVLYSSLTFRSISNLWEEFHFSAPKRVEQFVKAWYAFLGALGQS
jgi:hypothetical protein